MRTRRVILLGSFLFSALVAGIFLNPLLGFIDRYNSILGWMATIMTWIASHYYFKSERFYLFVQRYFVLPFNSSSARWKLVVRFDGCQFEAGTIEVGKIAVRILDAFSIIPGDTRIQNQLSNRFELLYRDEIAFAFDLSLGRLPVSMSLATSTFTVPSHRYEQQIRQLTELFHRIEKAVSSTSASYQINISFERRNPYFGYFVRHIPRQLISEFRCNFFVDRTANTRVSATRDSIVIDSNDYLQFERTSVGYLTLSENLVTAD